MQEGLVVVRASGQGARRTLAFVAAFVIALLALPAVASAQSTDPRVGLGAGWLDAEEASQGLDLLAHQNKPDGFFNPNAIGSLSFANSDLAFRDGFAFVGNFTGFNIYDVSDPSAPSLRTSVVCPGGQGDLSIHGDLLFMSVEETRGKIDCTLTPAATTATRFRGVRIFDVSDIDQPVQVAAVQTCRGSHTHTLVSDPDDAENLYVYVSGTAGIRSGAELAGCNGNSSLTDPTTANFRIDVIQVPLAAPQNAAVVSNPRVFSKCGSSACEGDYAVQEQHPDPRYGVRGTLNWLSPGGAQPTHPAGDPRAPGGQSVSQSSACHDITAFPEIGLAAGACQGDGILLDISDPVNPVRIDNVTDFNFAYWHSATFNNDGTKVVFTDEWGGGTGARCTPTFVFGGQQRQTPASWGANAIFDIVDTPEGKKMQLASYYKIPNEQTAQENCVAHNGSLVPVPGRDIMTQAWYQGGVSVFDFTDSANPKEIAFFDRGPVGSTLLTGGFWSTYYYDGAIFGSEIARGFDAFALAPSDQLSANEIAAAAEVDYSGDVNAQLQTRYGWAPSFAVVRSHLDQLVRSGELEGALLTDVTRKINRAESFRSKPGNASFGQLRAAADVLGDPRYEALRTAILDLSTSR